MSDIKNSMRDFLDSKVHQYNTLSYIESDPIQIPHRFSDINDIEISAFLAAQLAWGNRKSIIKSASRLIELMENSPYEWVKNATQNDFKVFNKFVYRTFNSVDTVYYIKKIQGIINNYNTLGNCFKHLYVSNGKNVREMLSAFYVLFMDAALQRTYKHLSNVSKGSAAKRLNLFLRWMVRNDIIKVDFGLWNFIPQNELYIPLDVHSSRVARKLNLLKRKTNDWKSVDELTQALKQFDPSDPAKYDYALFGLGIFEKF